MDKKIKIFLFVMIGFGLFLVVFWVLLQSLIASLPSGQNPKPHKIIPSKKLSSHTIKPKIFQKVTKSVVKKKKRQSPKRRVWVGKPSKLPSHHVLLQRIKDRYKTDALPPVKPSSKFYILKRSQLKEWLKLPLAQSGARFIPELRGGRPNGIRVRNTVQPNSLYGRLGLHKNDVLMRVNGRPVYSPGHAHKYYKTIAKRYRNLTLQFRRGRKVYTRDFTLR